MDRYIDFVHSLFDEIEIETLLNRLLSLSLGEAKKSPSDSVVLIKFN